MASLSSKSGLSLKAKLDEEEKKYQLERKHVSEEIYELNDLIGPFGLYQVIVMVFACLREALTSFDSVGPSLILPMDDTYRCAINESLNQHSLEVPESGYDRKCYYIDTTNDSLVPCTKWIFQDRYKHSMLAQWELICDKEYLASMVHSSFFLGLLLGTVIWGPLADKIGRWKSYSICHISYLVFGSASVFAPNVYWFMFFRFLSGLNAIGYFILYTLQVEMIGIKWRSFSNTLNHAGWGLGVLVVPFIGYNIYEWRYLIAVVPIINALLVPWMLFLPESIRWMILDRQFVRAKKEIKRAAKINKIVMRDMDKKIDKFIESKEIERLNSATNQPNAGFWDLFTNNTLFKALVSLSLIYGILMYIYYSRTLHFAPDDASMFANFIITGSGEWLSLFISGTVMFCLPRKMTIFLFLAICTTSLIVEGIYHAQVDVASPVINYIIDAFIKVFGMCAIMVTWLVMLESFPTSLRQSGTTVVLLVGQLIIVVAPFHIEFEEYLGAMQHTGVIVIILICLALSVKFCIRETGKTELLDSVAVDSNARPPNDHALSLNGRGNKKTTVH